MAAGVRGFEALGRARVMGIVNVTPDSFSDGGVYFDREEAVAAGLRMRAEGADLVDVGGESTRPGAERVSEQEERQRVLPVVTELVDAGVPVSVDTSRASVAAAALDAGASMVNDVTGGADPDMFPLVAERDAAYVLMHGRGPSRDMQSRAAYRDVVAEVCDELAERLAAARSAGVRAEQVLLDPGIGFAKEAEHNWALLAGLSRLAELGQPLLVGTSRKSFLGRLLTDGQGRLRPVDRRDAATVATTALAAFAGVWGIRVHEVAANVDAVLVAAAWRAGAATSGRD